MDKTLKELLKNGWTLRQIAGALHIAYITVQRWHSGWRRIPGYQIEHLKLLPEKPPVDCPLAPMREQNKQNKIPD